MELSACFYLSRENLYNNTLSYHWWSTHIGNIRTKRKKLIPFVSYDFVYAI